MCVNMNLCLHSPVTPHFLLSSETVLREVFVISHRAHGASSKPVCELKCSSINFSTVYSPVKNKCCVGQRWIGGILGPINPKYTNTSNEMSHCSSQTDLLIPRIKGQSPSYRRLSQTKWESGEDAQWLRQYYCYYHSAVVRSTLSNHWE